MDDMKACSLAFDQWYAMQRHHLSNEGVCRVIWQASWNSAARPPAPAAQTDDEKILWGIAANAGRSSIFRRPRWAHVSDATGKGSTSAAALCRRFGFDPDEVTGDQLQPDPDDAPTAKPVEQATATCNSKRLRDALVGLVGSGDVDHLRGMELLIRKEAGADEDSAVAINAIHVLIATAPDAEVSHG